MCICMCVHDVCVCVYTRLVIYTMCVFVTEGKSTQDLCVCVCMLGAHTHIWCVTCAYIHIHIMHVIRADHPRWCVCMCVCVYILLYVSCYILDILFILHLDRG